MHGGKRRASMEAQLSGRAQVEKTLKLIDWQCQVRASALKLQVRKVSIKGISCRLQLTFRYLRRATRVCTNAIRHILVEAQQPEKQSTSESSIGSVPDLVLHCHRM